jgi:hypothetical protein
MTGQGAHAGAAGAANQGTRAGAKARHATDSGAAASPQQTTGDSPSAARLTAPYRQGACNDHHGDTCHLSHGISFRVSSHETKLHENDVINGLVRGWFGC